MNKSGKTLSIALFLLVVSGFVFWIKYADQYTDKQQRQVDTAGNIDNNGVPSVLQNISPVDRKTATTELEHSPQPSIYHLRPVDALINMLENNPQSVESLGYQAIRKIEHYCDDDYKIRDSFGDQEYFNLASPSMGVTEAKLREEKYTICMKIPDWSGLKKAVAAISMEDTSGLYISEQLLKTSEEMGVEYAQKIALDIWNSSSNPLAVLNASDFLMGTPGFRVVEKKFLMQSGMSTQRVDDLEGAAGMFQFCMMGGDCSQTSNLALNAICMGNEQACGLGVIAAMQEYWLSPSEFRAFEEWWYISFLKKR